jgi:glucose/arabinose dehydrogenase
MAACGSAAGDDSSAATTGGATAPQATAQAPAAAAATGVRLVKVGSFDSPVYVTSPPGDRRRLFVVEQGGVIRVIRGGNVLPSPFLNISSSVTSGGEQGLLSMAFAPDYATSGRFYVYYTDKQAKERVVEYRRASADRANAGSARLVMRMDDPEANHNGGLLVFGPDKLLYIGTGDGGGANDQHGTRGNAQNLGSPLGKLLRIDPRASGGQAYSVPSSNPFASRQGARPEIYAYGLRNPWRFSFDRTTGDLVIGDVGQNAVEEIDFVRRGDGSGVNWGWRPLEGTRRNFPDETAPGARAPVIEHTHAEGFCSITGGYIVRDPKLPALRGRYVYGDYCEGHIRSARLRVGERTTGKPVSGLPKVSSLSSFGQDASGRVYAVSLEGPVYRLASK